jgi:hypothetical protein
MPENCMTRRMFVGSIAAAGLAIAGDGWEDLFNGSDLAGWRPSENQTSWKVVDGLLTGDGPRSHLFYTGRPFRNFELEAEVRTFPNADSGIYFHTTYQESGWPDQGLEIQINNTGAGPAENPERSKTGSLYGLRNVYKQLLPDNQWFTVHVLVRGKTVQVRLNGTLVVDYVEPTPPVVPDGQERRRYLGHGTFALQCHHADSKVQFRRVRVRRLADDLPAPIASPAADNTSRQIVHYGRHNIPMVDFHVHLKEGLTLQQALAKSRLDGIFYGIAVNCGKGFPIQDDAGVRAFYESMKDQPVFIGMQAEGREWTGMFSRSVAALFDYVFTDSMTWTDESGKRMRTWIPEEVGAIADPQAFMETLVTRAVGILENEPIDIYVNPTFLPDVIARDYDRLWTGERMKKVIGAAARNRVAIEINDRYRLPSPAFVRLAKEAGCKFTFGTNNTGPGDLGRCEYGLRLVEECRLDWRDFFIPGTWWPKAIERKGGTLRP